MKTINTATTGKTNAYFYSQKAERFGDESEGVNHGFKADLEIIVDAHLTAQELDVVFAAVL